VHFFLLRAEDVRSLFSKKLKETVFNLVKEVSATFAVSCANANAKVSHQWSAAIQHNMLNENRHHLLTKTLHNMVKRFFRIQDRQEELKRKDLRMISEIGMHLPADDSELTRLRRLWDIDLENAKNLCFFTNFNWGPIPIRLRSWLDCNNDVTLAKRLEGYMVNRLLWNSNTSDVLPDELKTINDIFIKAYFCETLDSAVTKLMKNVGINVPFCLPFIGDIVRGDGQENSAFFKVRQGIYIREIERGNILTIEDVSSGACLFRVSQTRLGCISLKNDVVSDSKIQSLCGQVSISQAPELRFLKSDTNIVDVIQKLDDEGYVVVSFNDTFVTSVTQILPDGHLSQLSSGVVKREWFDLDGVEEWQTPIKEVVEVIIGPMREACTELMKCIDVALFGNGNYDLHRFMHQKLLLASSGAKNQRPVVDVVCQGKILSNMAVSQGILSVIGTSMNHYYWMTINCILQCYSEFILLTTASPHVAGNFQSPPPPHHGTLSNSSFDTERLATNKTK